MLAGSLASECIACNPQTGACVQCSSVDLDPSNDCLSFDPTAEPSITEEQPTTTQEPEVTNEPTTVEPTTAEQFCLPGLDES